jgi:hypothetical protein
MLRAKIFPLMYGLHMVSLGENAKGIVTAYTYIPL